MTLIMCNNLFKSWQLHRWWKIPCVYGY